MTFCGECGQPLEGGARFCAGCGTPVAAVEPQAAVKPQAPASPPATAGVPSSPLAAIRQLVAGRQLGPKLLVGGGLLALLGVVAVLLNGLGGGTNGADSPAAAVQKLVDASQKEDPAGVLATLEPDQARLVADLYGDLRKRVGGAFVRSDGGLAGTQVTVSGLRLDSEDLGHGVAKVVATSGRLSAAFKGDGLASVLVPHEASQREVRLSGAGDEYVMVRRHDNGWFVSPLLTALQQIVEYAGLPQPDFALLDEPPDAAAAAATPQQLLTGLAGAVSDRDADGLLELLSVREFGVLRAYRAAIQDLVGRVPESLAATVASSDITQKPIGTDLVRLDIKHASVNATLSSDFTSQQVEVRLNGLCVNTRSSGGSSFHGCDTNAHRILGIDDPFIVAERTGSHLRLAPLATIKAYLDALVDRAGDAGVRRIFGAVADGRARGTLISGIVTRGQLNDGGYALHEYKARAGELVALETDRSAQLVAPDGSPVQAQACLGANALYELAQAGTYRVVVTGATYAPGPYHVVAEHVTAASAGVPSVVSGSVGERARIAVLRFQAGVTPIQFTTDSPVYSAMVSGDSSSGCGGPSNLDAVRLPGFGLLFGAVYSNSLAVGPLSVILHTSDRPAAAPTSGAGNSSEFDGTAGERLLVVSGARGTRFRGTLAEASLGE